MNRIEKKNNDILKFEKQLAKVRDLKKFDDNISNKRKNVSEVDRQRLAALYRSVQKDFQDIVNYNDVLKKEISLINKIQHLKRETLTFKLLDDDKDLCTNMLKSINKNPHEALRVLGRKFRKNPEAFNRFINEL